ncbi:MAG: Zn-ribbon domain-containing OB-fold protein [Planctomycetota bacterium]|nr:Zn-ribbon domain-containing OB-fold protein [Planctomycetota bacterium]MDI6788621.1 Zn-ribbon domain-containing OB-fold protein [Planctomycetota bacterium]
MALIERYQKTNEVGFWEGKIPMNYVYTCGRAGEKFFREIINGKIFGTKCAQCNITYVPPRIYCEKCFERLEDKYIDVGTKGKVHTFTQCYETFDGNKKETSSIVAMVKIDGTEGGFVHWIGEVDFKDVHIGMPVQAVFKPAKSREGNILDIKYFVPSGSE